MKKVNSGITHDKVTLTVFTREFVAKKRLQDYLESWGT